MKQLLLAILFLITINCINAQNFGVGTQSPNAKVHVIQENNSKSFQVDDEKSDITPFVIDSVGNVGIKNASPSEALDINGNVKVSGNIEASGRIMDKTGFIMPVGTVLPYTGNTAPKGWLVCDGTAMSRTVYADLFAVVGVSFGEGDGFSTFHLPDFRGIFLRGWDNSAGNDPDASSRTALNTGGNTGDKIGSFQSDAAKISAAGSAGNQTGTSLIRKNNGLSFTDIHGNETRPVNVNINYIIKY